MKKLKQVLFADNATKPPENKNSSYSKAYGIWRSKTNCKKLKQNFPKESKHHDESKLKSSRSPLKSAKSNLPKKNKRSKSLVYDKKPLIKIETTHNSSQLAVELKCLKKEEKLPEKELDFYSSNSQSKVEKAFSTVEDRSPFFTEEKIDCSTQCKQILIVDAQIQCEEFRIEEEKKTKALISSYEREKSKFQLDLGVLQQRMQLIAKETEQRQKETQSAFCQEVNQLKGNIDRLKKTNYSLSIEKQNLKEVLKMKESQIQMFLKNQKVLQEKIEAQKKEKERIMEVNQLLKKEVSFYREELKSFEQNLQDFQKMKGAYEKRLNSLESQKIKIKKHAKELLTMVQIYKKREEQKD